MESTNATDILPALSGRSYQRYDTPTQGSDRHGARLTVGALPTRLHRLAALDIHVNLVITPLASAIASPHPPRAVAVAEARDLCRRAQTLALRTAFASRHTSSFSNIPAETGSSAADTGAGALSLRLTHRRWRQQTQTLLVSAARGTEWILPKGGWETFESARAGAAREVYEESGALGALAPGPAAVVSARAPAAVRTLRGQQQLLLLFFMRAAPPAARFPEQDRPRRWFSLLAPAPTMTPVPRSGASTDADVEAGAGAAGLGTAGAVDVLRRPPLAAVVRGWLRRPVLLRWLAAEAAGELVASAAAAAAAADITETATASEATVSSAVAVSGAAFTVRAWVTVSTPAAAEAIAADAEVAAAATPAAASDAAATAAFAEALASWGANSKAHARAQTLDLHCGPRRPWALPALPPVPVASEPADSGTAIDPETDAGLAAALATARAAGMLLPDDTGADGDVDAHAHAHVNADGSTSGTAEGPGAPMDIGAVAGAGLDPGVLMPQSAAHAAAALVIAPDALLAGPAWATALVRTAAALAAHPLAAPPIAAITAAAAGAAAGAAGGDAAAGDVASGHGPGEASFWSAASIAALTARSGGLVPRPRMVLTFPSSSAAAADASGVARAATLRAAAPVTTAAAAAAEGITGTADGFEHGAGEHVLSQTPVTPRAANAAPMRTPPDSAAADPTADIDADVEDGGTETPLPTPLQLQSAPLALLSPPHVDAKKRSNSSYAGGKVAVAGRRGGATVYDETHPHHPRPRGREFARSMRRRARAAASAAASAATEAVSSGWPRWVAVRALEFLLAAGAAFALMSYSAARTPKAV